MFDVEKMKRILAMKPNQPFNAENLPSEQVVRRVDPTTLPALGRVMSEIEFHGDKLTVIHHEDGRRLVVMKPIAERLGLDWSAQYRRILRDDVLSKGVAMMAIPSEGGKQESLLLDIEMFHGWLFTIDSARVKPEIKPVLLTYKLECYKALHDFHTKGYAINERKLNGDLSHTGASASSTDLIAVSMAVVASAYARLHVRDSVAFLHSVSGLLLRIHNADKPDNSDRDQLIEKILATGESLDMPAIQALTRSSDGARVVRRLRADGVPITQVPNKSGRISRFALAKD